MNETYCIVMTTVAKIGDGKKIIEALLDKQLAACIQVMPIQSFYRWEGELTNDAEQLLLIKTKRALYKRVQQLILAQHPYDLPEIIQVPITDGFPAYLRWIDQECSQD